MARADAEASADRLADEPPQPPLTTRLAYGLTGIGRRLAHASLTLEAALENPARAQDQPPAAQQARRAKVVDQFADGVEAAARVVAGSLRSLRPPADMPPLREFQSAVYQEFTDDQDGPGGGAPPLGRAGLDSVLVSATDEYTDAFDTAADVLRQRLKS